MFADFYTKQWTKQSGTAENDSGDTIAIDSAGNIYIAGTTSGGLDGNTNAGGDTGTSDLFLIKYNSSGVKQWTKQLGSTEDESVSGIVLDSAGNLYITGSTAGGLDGNANAGGTTGTTDLFLIKYNSSGVKQWTKQLGSTEDESVSGLVIDAAVNLYITGSTAGGLDGNTNAGGTTGTVDLFLVKYNSSGAKQWTKQLGSAEDETATGLAVDNSANLYITGSTTGGLDGNTNAG